MAVEDVQKFAKKALTGSGHVYMQGLAAAAGAALSGTGAVALERGEVGGTPILEANGSV